MRVIQTKGTNKAHVTRRRNSTQPTDSWLLNYVCLFLLVRSCSYWFLFKLVFKWIFC